MVFPKMSNYVDNILCYIYIYIYIYIISHIAGESLKRPGCKNLLLW